MSLLGQSLVSLGGLHEALGIGTAKLNIAFLGQNKWNQRPKSELDEKREMKNHRERQLLGEVERSLSEIDKQCICWFCNFSPCHGGSSTWRVSQGA